MSSVPSPTIRPTGAQPTADDGYASEVRAVWSEFLATLPEEARLLDIGVGNHVPALLAADIAIAQGRDWSIDAIDPQPKQQGKRAPANAERLDRITLHADASLSRLPFDDASFDAVCGHHVVEFSDPDVTLSEVKRVLRPGGDAQFTLHHADSVLVGSARLSLREADLVFTQTKAFRRLHRLVTMSQIVPDSTERATNELRRAIRALKRGRHIAQQHGGGRVLDVALDAIQNLLATRREIKPDQAGLAVDRSEAELRASVRRLQTLVDFARTEDGMQDIEDKAAAIGFTQVERIVQMHAGTQIIGWQLLLHRP